MPDNVKHPAHYNSVKSMPEVWDILDAFFSCDPDKWNAGKYLLRAELKGIEKENLQKCVEYLQRRIDKLNAKDEACAVATAEQIDSAKQKMNVFIDVFKPSLTTQP